jgi:hypothetical protein
VPFLRVIRDKRGYETTYLMDWYREGSRQRSRILYMFRTPGGVRVGRAALEPDILRHIQTHRPDVVFDWKTVLDTRQVIDAAPEPRRSPPRRRADEEPAETTADEAVAGSLAPAQPPAAGRPPFPSTIEGANLEEQLAFLGQWYPVARERIMQRIVDLPRREALLALAERVNPSVLAQSEDAAAGVADAAEALERLSRVLVRRRRRSGRGRPGQGEPDPQAQDTSTSDPQASADPVGDEPAPPGE